MNKMNKTKKTGNKTMDGLVALLFFVSIFAIWASVFIGVGYALYLWGALGNPIGFALWNGFLTWLYFLGGGFIGALISIVIADMLSKK